MWDSNFIFFSKESTFKNFVAHPPAKITWKRNGREISGTSKSLKIDLESDTGRYSETSRTSRIYQCFIENEVGVTSALIDVRIKPQKPEIPQEDRESPRPQIVEAECYPKEKEFVIKFKWESRLIQPNGFYYSIFREDKEEQIYNPYPLYHPNSKQEWAKITSRCNGFKITVLGPYRENILHQNQ